MDHKTSGQIEIDRSFLLRNYDFGIAQGKWLAGMNFPHFFIFKVNNDKS